MRVQVSSAMLFDMVAAGEEFTIREVQWRHTSDSASERQRLFTMVFRWVFSVKNLVTARRVSRHSSNASCWRDPRRDPLCRPSGTARSAHGAPAMHMADEAASASNLCYFVAIHEVLQPSHSLTSISPSLATTMGPAPATPFTGLELGPLLGKARPLWHGRRPIGHAYAASCCLWELHGPRSHRFAAHHAGRLRARVPGSVWRVHRCRKGARTCRKATLQHSAVDLVL